MQQSRVMIVRPACGWTLLLALILACSFRLTSGHGYLHTPAGRGTIGYPTPINPDHMSNYCGGFVVLQASGGKCGVCGDPWDGPRKHEVGGQYATGKITGSYKAGAVIPIKVHITANHMGWIEFRLCPVTNQKVEVTQQCLNRNLLKFEDGKTRRTVARHDEWITAKLKLPDNITCSRCVLQWKYRAGNMIYLCPDGTVSASCGQQVEYYNCADISISGTSSTQASPTPKTNSATKPTAAKPTVARPSGKCVAIGIWAKQPDMFTWCVDNCARGNCPADKCAC